MANLHITSTAASLLCFTQLVGCGLDRADGIPRMQATGNWRFNKDGVDLDMVDICNDTKAAQLDSRNTFVSVGKNMYVPA